MDDTKIKSPIVILGIFLLSTALLVFTQSSQTKLVLFPLLVLMTSVAWYMQKLITKATTFPSRIKLLKTHHVLLIANINALIICSFTFFWSFFVSGLGTALVNTGLNFLLFIILLMYLVLAPKEYTTFAKLLARKYRRYARGPWSYSYFVLLPFLLLCFMVYSLTTVYTTLDALLFSLPNFFIFYTLFFISLYSLHFLYLEYHREEETVIKHFVKKLFE